MEDKQKLPGEVYEHLSDYRADIDAHDNQIVDYDAYEAMLISKTYDSVSRKTKNGITDGDAATMIIERSARVVGQLPQGLTEAAGRRDRGKAALMDILRTKWYYPNANAQRPFLEKLRLWEMYSGVYGIMPMFYDWDVSPSGYVGPNCWLWNPRNLIPQQGRYTIEDMDYVHAISWMSKSEIENLLENFDEESGWKREALQTVLEAVEGSSKEKDTQRSTYVERDKDSNSIPGRLKIVTRFEAGDDGRWVTFTDDFGGLVLRDIENPHGNGKIPFIIKSAIPLFDSFYGLGELQRAKPLQFAKDGLTNFYFQGIKMNIYPPTVVNSQGILKHTVSNEPGSIWEEIIPNSARRLETSTAGLATYQAAMGQMSGALQNVFGTTTTQANAESAMNPAFGKTPEALRMQSARESARDNQNRARLQTAIEQLMDAFNEMVVNIGTESIDIDLFRDDIEALVNSGMDDVMEMILPNESLETGRLIINPATLKGVTYRFNMKPDSTIKKDKEEQRQSLVELLGVLGKHQNELQEIQKSSGKVVNWEQIFQSYAELSDIPGLSEVFIQGEVPKEQSPALILLEKLDIKYDNLPEDAKHFVMQQLGIPSQQPSPRQQELNIDKSVAAAKVFDMAKQELEEQAEESAIMAGKTTKEATNEKQPTK